MINRTATGRAVTSRAVAVALILMGLSISALAQTTQPATRARFSRTADQEIRFQEGLLHYSRGELTRAEADFQGLVDENAADAEAYYHLGLAQLDQRKYAAAIENFDQSLRLDPTPNEVRAARATAHVRAGEYDKAEPDLEILRAEPRWRGMARYLEGQILYRKGDLEGAAEAFADAKAAGGVESAPAEFYEGLTYLRMKELVRARATFREASLGPERDPTLAAASRQLDAVLAAQQQRDKPWEFQLTLAYEWDSNVVQLGSDITLPDDISDEEDSRYIVQPRGSYSFLRSSRWELGLEGNGYFAWQSDLTDFDIESYQGGPFLNYKIKDNWFASVRYGFNYIELGHDPFMTRHVITPQLTWVQPKFGYTSAFYQYQSRDLKDTPSRESFDLDGQINTVGLVQGFNLPSLFGDAGPATLELSYRYENQDTEGSDFDGDFHSVGVTLYTPLPFFKLRADVGVNVSFDGYDNPNSLDADGDERDDVEVQAVVGLTKEITETLAFRVDYTFNDRDSNVETAADQSPFDFDRHQVGARLIFSY